MGRKSKRNQIEMPVEVSSAKKLKTAAYVRISDEKEGDSSIHTQISMIHKFIAENAELEKELNSASRESIQKKLKIQRKLSELDELRRTVDAIPHEVIRAYTAQKYMHHGRMNQEI